MNRFEDLAPLIAPKGVARGSVVGFRQGVVESWNQTTGANTIRVGGTLFTDLPITASSLEIKLIEPGDVVGIDVVSGSSAFATMYVTGRITVPGTPEAVQAIRDAIASNSFSALVATQQTLVPGGGWSNLATVGPTLSNITVGSSGKCLVTVSAFMSHGGALLTAAYMGVEVSGATSIAPATGQALTFGTANNGWTFGASRTFLLTLNPGVHTFQAKYRNDSVSGNASFEQRTLEVVAF